MSGDDSLVIIDNNFIKSWSNFPKIFTKSYLSPFVKRGCCFFIDTSIGSGETSYRPMVTLSYFFDYSLWKMNPFGYHLTNLIIHIFNAALVYFFIYLLLKSKKISFFAATLFALHPVNSETVNIPAFREDLLVFMFFLAAFIMFIKLNTYSGRKKIYCYLASVILFLLALFSKEAAIVFPFLIITYDHFFVIRKVTKVSLSVFTRRYLGYFIILSFYIWVRFFLITNTGEPPVEYPGGSFYTNLLTMPKVIAMYMKWLFLPGNILPIMPNENYLIPSSLFDPWCWVSTALILGCIALAVSIRDRLKEVSFAIIWFFIALLPVSNIVPLSNYIAGRYLYFPLVGFCLLLSVLLFRLKTFNISLSLLPKLTGCAAMIILAFYSLSTIKGNTLWRNNTIFLSKMAKVYPNNSLTHATLGNSFRDNKLFEDAVKEYKIALKLNPGLVEIYNNLGVIFGDMGKYEEAVDCFNQSIKTDPGYLESYNNLGVTYIRLQRWSDAEKIWKEALKINPKYKEARENLNKMK